VLSGFRRLPCLARCLADTEASATSAAREQFLGNLQGLLGPGRILSS
jgi:hypothetical protein